MGGGGNGGGGLPQLSFAILLLVVVVQSLPALVASLCGDKAVVFNFGDSNSDTGGNSAGLGNMFPLPEGRVFFHRSTGRICDGRLIIDFLRESLNASYLSPYLESLGSDFHSGANFAIAGASTLPENVPFSLKIQVNQFVRFKSQTLELVARGSKHLINEEGFQKALYTIDIGQNDLTGLFYANLPYDQIVAKIPPVIAQIKSAMKTLHDQGGRNFWIHNTGPLGCLPQKLALPRGNDSALDPNGCLVPFNNAAKEFNAQLSTLCDELRSELSDARIVYTDIFSAKYDLIANYKKYGFEKPLTACCGDPSRPPYNYNPNVQCLGPGFQVCSDGSKYISWDGVHYTEAANAMVACKILSTAYSKPSVKFDFFCAS